VALLACAGLLFPKSAVPFACKDDIAQRTQEYPGGMLFFHTRTLSGFVNSCGSHANVKLLNHNESHLKSDRGAFIHIFVTTSDWLTCVFSALFQKTYSNV
jgi:hypothetical protein